MTRKIKAKGVEEFIEKRLELNYVCSLVDNIGKDQEQEQVGAVAHMPDLTKHSPNNRKHNTGCKKYSWYF